MNDLPRVFGKYVLLERLAAGGMGEVFLAKSGAESFQRFFAIKCILAEHAESPGFLEMLMQEARVSIELGHANIVQVFDVGRIEGDFYMAMEFVEGLSHRDVIRGLVDRKRRLPMADSLFIVQQLCRALDYAWNKVDVHGNPLKLIHRDISPHNLLIDESASVKLIDFGIAKAAEGEVKTEQGVLKGKMPYMSPEQARGEPLDHRSDLYSAGICLYESLIGARAHRGGNTINTLMRVQKGEIPAFEKRLEKLPPEVHPILRRALAASKEERYENAAEMERAISAAIHQLEPGYTSQRLARLVTALDTDRAERKARLKEYAAIDTGEDLDPKTISAIRFISRSAPAKKADAGSEAASNPALEESIVLDISVNEEPDDEPVSAPSATVATRADDAPLPAPAGGKKAALLVGAVVVAALLIFAAVQLTGSPALVRRQVVSEPADATVRLDGRVVGRTPMEISYAAGSAPHLLLELDRHGSHEQTLDDEPGVVRVSLRPLIAATPPEPAPVEPDPVEPPPVEPPPVEPKPVAKPKPVVRPKPKPVVKPKPRPTPKPIAQTGCVSIRVEPWAYIEVGGKRVGDKSMSCLELPVGTHTITLRNPALGKTEKVTVKVRAGKTAKVNVAF